VNDLDPLTESHPGRKGRIIASRVDRDLVAAAGEGRGEGRDVNVLTAGVDSAEGGKRAGML
jgi:hypothetical protein